MVSLRKMNEHDLLSWWMFHIELLANSSLWPGPRRRMRWLQQRKQLLQATGPRPRSHLGWASFATRLGALIWNISPAPKESLTLLYLLWYKLVLLPKDCSTHFIPRDDCDVLWLHEVTWGFPTMGLHDYTSAPQILAWNKFSVSSLEDDFPSLDMDNYGHFGVPREVQEAYVTVFWFCWWGCPERWPMVVWRPQQISEGKCPSWVNILTMTHWSHFPNVKYPTETMVSKHTRDHRMGVFNYQ